MECQQIWALNWSARSKIDNTPYSLETRVHDFGGLWIPLALFAQLCVLTGFGYRLIDAAFDLFPTTTWNSYLVRILASLAPYFVMIFL